MPPTTEADAFTTGTALPGIDPPWQVRTQYQPIVRIDTGQPVLMEVLARLGHPEQAWRLPSEFVPDLERDGWAWGLTRAVLRSAFDDWAGERLATARLPLALNFPLDVFVRPEAIDMLDEVRAGTAVPADGVLVELTESRIPDDLPGLRRAAMRLVDAGYRTAIDDVVPERDPAQIMDFGFSVLKLDTSLAAVVQNRATTAFLARTIAAAHASGMTVVAEGIEDLAAWNCARDRGADLVQGFLVARPIAAAAVVQWQSCWSAP